MKRKVFTNIDDRYLHTISKVFTPMVIESLAMNGRSDYLREVCANSAVSNQIDLSTSIANFLNSLYLVLFKRYRNEYIYKNTIANKILLGRHSLSTARMLTEFRVGKCKADVVVINGTSTVYEIKSEFDSFSRLDLQISSYLKAFDYINVITSESQTDKIRNMLPTRVGILVLTDRNTISTLRKATSNVNEIDPNILFDSFRKNEYLEVIQNYYSSIPSVPNTLIYRECKKLFCNIPTAICHEFFIKAISRRCNTNNLRAFINLIPTSLTAYAIRISDDYQKLRNITSMLSEPIGSVFHS